MRRYNGTRGLSEDRVRIDISAAGEGITAGFAEKVAPSCRYPQFSLKCDMKRVLGGAVAVSESGNQFLAF
jgi:hypothetical protein